MTAKLETTGWRRRPQGVATSVETAPTETWTKTLPTGLIETEGYRGIRIAIIGDTDDDDYNFEVWTVERSYTLNELGTPVPVYLPREFTDVDVVTIGDGSPTFGTGSAREDLLKDTEFFADLYTTHVISTYGQKVLANFNGSSDVFSPGATAGTMGELFISDLGNCFGVVIVGDTFTTGDYFDAMFKLDV